MQLINLVKTKTRNNNFQPILLTYTFNTNPFTNLSIELFKLIKQISKWRQVCFISILLTLHVKDLRQIRYALHKPLCKPLIVLCKQLLNLALSEKNGGFSWK